MSAASARCAALSADLDVMRQRRDTTVRRVVRDTPSALAAVRADLTARLQLHAASLGPLSRAVLIVDDDAALCELMAAAVARALGVPVDTAHTIDDADALWRKRRHRVAVIDLHLGSELGAALAHSLDRGVRVVLTSGIADPAALDAAADRLGAAPMAKPPDRLVELVSDALDSGPRTRLA